MSGEAPSIPFFAPAWIKAIGDNMKLPSDKLLYLVVGAKNKPGARWESPSDSMNFLALASTPGKDGWMKVDHTFKTPHKVVGLWIMADGDNPESVFETRVKSLVVE